MKRCTGLEQHLAHCPHFSLRFAMAVENAERLEGTSPAVLVLGGSTFMGRETVDALLQLPARVCVVNRGRAYWGTRDPSGGRVARVAADRRDPRAFAERLDGVTQRVSRWALVADFSAYNGADVQAALEGLRGRFDVYAYVSSDSVYEVSMLAGSGWAGAGPVGERLSERPADAASRKRLKKADNYGDGKLEAEEALVEGLKGTTSRAVALRLPDVIGPFDDTMRLWAYWHWWHAGPDNLPQVRKTLKRPRDASAEDPPLAFVFSRDVARFMVHVMGSGPPGFDAVNLGCNLQVPLKEFLELLANASGLPKSSPSAVDRPKGFLPSVDRPVPLDFRHLQEVYQFATTPLPEVLRITAEWFAEACNTFPEEAAEAAMKLPPDARAPALAHAGLEMPTPRSSSSSSDSGSH